MKYGHPPKHEPTSKEIAEACERIRERWADDERLKRLRPDWRPVEPMAPLVAVMDLLGAAARD